MKKTTFSPFLLTLFTCSLTTHAIAETSDSNTDEHIKSSNAVIVEGQKIDRTRQDTVDSVSIFTAEDLDSTAKSNDFYDLLDQTANVGRESGFSYQIRGIGNNGPSNSENGARTISFLLDDVIQSDRATQESALSLWDLESVEILRGAQSTSLGRNSLAGAFVFRSKDPEFENSGHAKIAYGNYNTYQAAIAQTGPLSKKLAYRVSLNHNHSDGYSKNTFFDKTNWDQHTSNSARAKLKYITDEKGELLFTVYGSELDDRGDDNVIARNSDPTGYKKREAADNYDGQWLTKTQNASLKYTTQISPTWEFVSTTTYGQTQYDRDTDTDSEFDKGIFYVNSKNHDASQEFLFKHSGNRSKNTLGIYTSKGELKQNNSATDFSYDFRGLLAFVNYRLITEEQFENAAIFYNSDTKLTKNVTLIAGIRADYEKRESLINVNASRARSTGNPAVDAQISGYLARQEGDSAGTYQAVTPLPKLGLDYKWSDTLNTGIMIQRGYRPGGVSTNPVQGKTQKFDPEFTTNYELSLRKTNASKTFSFNANAFYTDWKNQQIRLQKSNDIYDVFVENAGRSHISGIEIESDIRASDTLSFGLSAGYSKTEFDDFKPRGKDFSGKEFRYARKWTAGARMNYYHNSGFFLNTQLNHSADAWANQANTIKIDGKKIWNIKTGYEQDAWRSTLYVNNVLDEIYVNEFIPRTTLGFTEYVLGAPRTFGANLELFW